MNEHTKGPWLIVNMCAGEYQIGRERGANQIEVLASVKTAPHARLIAAAPEMLHQLRISYFYLKNEKERSDVRRLFLKYSNGRIEEPLFAVEAKILDERVFAMQETINKATGESE